MQGISGFLIVWSITKFLGVKGFEGRGFNTSRKYEKLENCWITDESRIMNHDPTFLWQMKIANFLKSFIKQFFTSF